MSAVPDPGLFAASTVLSLLSERHVQRWRPSSYSLPCLTLACQARPHLFRLCYKQDNLAFL